MADPHRSRRVPRPKKSRRAYARGGSVSDMVRLLERNEPRLESRLGWRRLVMAGVIVGVAVAVLLFAAMMFLAG